METMVADDVTRLILASYEDGHLISCCAWCRRVAIDGEWRLAPRMALVAIADFTLTHTICDPCRDMLPPAAASA